MLLTPLLFAAASWARIPEDNSGMERLNVAPVAKGRINDCGDCSAGFVHESVHLLPDVGAYAFNFGEGNSGLVAYQSFYFTIPETSLGVAFQIWDCFCSGDGFEVTVVDSPVPIPPLQVYGNVLANGACSFYDGTSEGCWDARDGGFNWNQGQLTQPGFYNITIQIATSPYRKGTGFLNLLSLCPIGNILGPCCSVNNDCNFSQYR